MLTIIKRADSANSVQFVTVFIRRPLAEILTLPNPLADIAPHLFPLGYGTARYAAKGNGMQYPGAFQIREGL